MQMGIMHEQCKKDGVWSHLLVETVLQAIAMPKRKNPPAYTAPAIGQPGRAGSSRRAASGTMDALDACTSATRPASGNRRAATSPGNPASGEPSPLERQLRLVCWN